MRSHFALVPSEMCLGANWPSLPCLRIGLLPPSPLGRFTSPRALRISYHVGHFLSGWTFTTREFAAFLGTFYGFHFDVDISDSALANERLVSGNGHPLS